MKKPKLLSAILATSLLLAACSSSDEPALKADTAEQETVITVPLRTAAQAAAIAEMAVQNEQAVSRSQRTVSSDTPVKALVSRTSRSDADTLLYVVQYEDNRGYAIISAPVNVEPLIALIDDGAYDDPATQTNEPFQATLQAAKDYVSTMAIITDPDLPKPPVTPVDPIPILMRWDTIKPTPKSTPRVTVKWGQSWPENMYTPNKVAGCGPVAVAQILSVFEKPTSLRYKCPDIEGSFGFFSWSEMKKHVHLNEGKEPSQAAINFHMECCSASQQSHNALGGLVREIGYRGNAIYAENATGMYFNWAYNVMHELLPDRNIDEYTKYSSSYLFDALVNKPNSVVYTEGFNENYGHAWVIDGTWSIGTKVIEYEYDRELKAYIKKHEYGQNTQYFHYNWGWYGNSNGYFLTTCTNPTTPYEYDSEWWNYATNESFSMSRKSWLVY